MPAGYSGTPLVRKLGVKAGHRVELIGTPDDWTVEGLPDDVELSQARGAVAVDIIIAFFNEFAVLRREVPRLALGIIPAGALWVGWPRRAGGHDSDITDNRIREVVLPLGLVDVKVAALDDNWSGLKVVWRREVRPTLG